MSDRIHDLSEFIRANIGTVIDEARDHITEAINAAVDDAQEEQKDAILSLSIGVKWNLDGNTVVLNLPVRVTRKFEAVGKLDDNQPGLPNMGDASLDRAMEAIERALGRGMTLAQVEDAIAFVKSKAAANMEGGE